MTAAIEIRGLEVAYGDTLVLDGIDLEVAGGEVVALLGPSGSGKTTLLYAIAGLLPVRAGSIRLAGRQVDGAVPPEERSVGMVFQNYALWPHLDALATVAYPLRRRGVEVEAAEREARGLLDQVGIGDLADRRPDQLSGGQQQRVGLARALAGSPAFFLFDEPTAHLDAAVRGDLQRLLVDPAVRGSGAVLYTTHDAGEALSVADRVAVLREGHIVQIGTPEQIYSAPADPWVAALTGPVSVLEVTVVGADGDRLELDLGGTRVSVSGSTDAPTGPARLLVRPEWATLGGDLEGEVAAVRFEGPHTDYTVVGSFGSVRVRRVGPPEHSPGEQVRLALQQGRVVAA